MRWIERAAWAVCALMIGLGGAVLAQDAANEVMTLDSDRKATWSLVGASGLASADFGDWTCNGTTCDIDANSVALTTDTTGNYAAGDAEAGAALTGDSATAFFSSGTIEDARLSSDARGFTVFISALAGHTSGTFVGASVPTAEFANGASQYLLNAVKIPAGATSISSLRIHTNPSCTSNNVYLSFSTTHFANAGGTYTTDAGAGFTTYDSGTAAQANVITVPSTSYDGVSITAGDYLNFKVERDAANASDTCEAVFQVIGFSVVFA